MTFPSSWVGRSGRANGWRKPYLRMLTTEEIASGVQLEIKGVSVDIDHNVIWPTRVAEVNWFKV